MSGIEVAGLVLGAFPIATALLEKYRDVAGHVNSWYKIRSEYQRSSYDLEFHRLSFEENLKQLLFPLVSDDGQLQDLIEKPGGPVWNDPALQRALENRLQKSYRVYMEILDEMQQTMQELNKELSVDNAQLQSHIREEKVGDVCFSSTVTRILVVVRKRSKTNRNLYQDHHPPSQSSVTSRFRKSLSQSNLEYQVFRVKFSLGERTRTRLFSRLETCNDRLGKLIVASDSISELRAGYQTRASELATSAMSAALCKFWNHADRLYEALMGAWGCACREKSSKEFA
ncbi:hypothetical protein F4823DRAFT_568174 [Ustulina deusta]|nr:hypothetical protein F4823DRAFT_568174 [Ustulina deusta]